MGSHKRFAIADGSIGGLTAACLLRDAGHDVTVYERSSRELEERGAGIGFLEASSRYLAERVGLKVDDISAATPYFRYLNRNSDILHEQVHRYRFSSWNTVYKALLVAFERSRYQFVWYRNYLAGGELTDLLTDIEGSVRELSVPPGLVSRHHVEEARAVAAARLPAELAAVVHAADDLFLQAVYDVEVPRMVFGRACLLGDAAFVARPHAAAGTAKAAEDGWQLMRPLRAETSIDAALVAWEKRQLVLGRSLVERARAIGRRSQIDNSWVAGDPQFLFGLCKAGESLAIVMATFAMALSNSMDLEECKAACRAFPDDDERKLWFFTPTDHGGRLLHAMDARQHRLVHQLVASGLSRAGYNTVAAIMGLENILDRLEGHHVDFGRERVTP